MQMKPKHIALGTNIIFFLFWIGKFATVYMCLQSQSLFRFCSRKFLCRLVRQVNSPYICSIICFGDRRKQKPPCVAEKSTKDMNQIMSASGGGVNSWDVSVPAFNGVARGIFLYVELIPFALSIIFLAKAHRPVTLILFFNIVYCFLLRNNEFSGSARLTQEPDRDVDHDGATDEVYRLTQDWSPTNCANDANSTLCFVEAFAWYLCKWVVLWSVLYVLKRPQAPNKTDADAPLPV